MTNSSSMRGWRGYSRTRFMSVHRLAVRGRPIGEVVMTSVFVHRTEPGLNRSIARVEVAGVPPVGSVGEFADYAVDDGGAASRPLERSISGLVRSDAPPLGRLVIDPCPAQDFNGADFLYFSSFQAFVGSRRMGFLAARQSACNDTSARYRLLRQYRDR